MKVLIGIVSELAVVGLLATATSAADDDYTEPVIKQRDREHWSFREISRPKPPSNTANPIDAFLLHRLKEEAGLDEFAPEADADTLLRRLTFTLTGLPPTLEQRIEFGEIGFEPMVDR